MDFMLLWGISRRSFIHGSHLVVRDQSGLAASAANHSGMSRAVEIFHFNIDDPSQIAVNFSERLLTIASNFFGMVGARIAAKHVLAFTHVRPGLTASICRVAGRLSLCSNPRSDIPRLMLHLSSGIEPGIFVMTVTGVAN